MTALDEYDDAIAKGRVVRSIGYQTARGFIQQADRMIESVAGEFTVDNIATLTDIRARLTQLKRAITSVNAPKQPLIDTSAVLVIISNIEMAAGQLI